MTKISICLQSLKCLSLPIAGLTVLWMAGCNESAPEATATITELPPETTPHKEHAHPSVGPHHGDLVELGNEEYHAEVVHGESGSVTVYILDSGAKTAAPIDASELTINISHDGKAEQFKLPAERDASDPEGRSSRFSVKDEKLAKVLDDHDAAAKLVVMIDGKSYSSKIEHSHEGEHAHDDRHQQ